MGSLPQHIRYSFVMMIKSPVSSVLAVVALALGIGLVTALFTIVKGALYSDLPYPESDRVFMVRYDPDSLEKHFSVQQDSRLRFEDFRDFRRHQTGFEALSCYSREQFNVLIGENLVSRSGVRITANLFDLLKVQPILGRGFVPEDDLPGEPLVVLVGYKLWISEFGGEDKVIGKSVIIDAESYTVVGVMPQGFRFPSHHDIWIPIRDHGIKEKREESLRFDVVGRLKRENAIEKALDEFDSIALHLSEKHPVANEGRTKMQILRFTDAQVGKEIRKILYALLASSALVLVIACANVSNLFLVRASQRSKELAIRSSLGARGIDVIAQMLAECLVLCFLGAVIGSTIAFAAESYLDVFFDVESFPFWWDFGVDLRVLAFVIAVTLIATLLAGLVPALRATRSDLNAILKDDARTSSGLFIGRLSKFSVVVQIALSCSLLVACGALLGTVADIDDLLPFDPGTVLTIYVELPANQYDYPQASAFFDRLLVKLKEVPGVKSAGSTSAFAVLGAGHDRMVIEGEPYSSADEHLMLKSENVSMSYFPALEVPILIGRNFRMTDTLDSENVVIVNRGFMERHFNNENPIGRRIRKGKNPEDPWKRIIGVVPVIRQPTETEDVSETGGAAGFYRFVRQYEGPSHRHRTVFVRTSGDPYKLSAKVQGAIRDLDPMIASGWLKTVDDSWKEWTGFFRFLSSIFWIFGISAVSLAGIGVYGLVYFSIEQSSRDIGIRLALGANHLRILSMYLKRDIVQITIALCLGCMMGYYLSNLMMEIIGQHFVLKVDPYAMAIALMISVALSATAFPVLRKSRVLPMVILK